MKLFAPLILGYNYIKVKEVKNEQGVITLARLSDVIEEFIKLFSGKRGSIELQRNELADYFECAPSQINYVLATRFPDQGYYKEQTRRQQIYQILRLM